MTDRCDVVVVGGGAMGSAAAWWLARRGRDVVLLERFEPGHVRGSSHGASRIFRLTYDEPDYVQLAQDSLGLWRELEDDAGQTLLETTGGVDHGDPSALHAIASALGQAGVVHERLRPEAAAERWPGMRFDGPVLHQPDAGRCLADATVAALQRRVVDHGGAVHHDVRVAAVEEAGGDGVRVVTAGGEAWEAPVAVVAAGSWAPALVDGLPPLQVSQEQVFHFRPSDPAAPWPSFIHHRSPFIYGLETPGEGVKVAEHHTGATVDPDHRTFEVDPAGRDRVAGYVRAWFPGVDPEPVHPTTCLYTTTPTEDFVLDRVGPVVVAAGFSGHGFKFTPAVGRLLADLADDPDAAGIPDRFRLASHAGAPPRTGHR